MAKDVDCRRCQLEGLSPEARARLVIGRQYDRDPTVEHMCAKHGREHQKMVETVLGFANRMRTPLENPK